MLSAAGDTGPALGAAILAGVGAGVYSSVPEAVEHLVIPEREVGPDSTGAQTYARSRSLYKKLYPSLKDRFAELTELI